MWSSDQQHQHQGTCWKCGVSGFTPDLWNNSVNLQEIHMHTNKKHLFTLLLLLTAPTLPHFSFCSRHWVVRPLSVLFNLVNVSSLPFWHGESGSDKAKGNFMDHSLKVQAKLCPTEPWKDRNFFFFFFLRAFAMELLMVYYFFAFSILGGTSWLLTVDNLETIMESFSVCLWCTAEMFETLNENRSHCRVRIIIRRQKSILFQMEGIIHHLTVTICCII